MNNQDGWMTSQVGRPLKQWITTIPGRYWGIIITYAIMQFSSLPVAVYLKSKGNSLAQMQHSIATWTIFSFCAALVIMLILLRREMRKRAWSPDRTKIGETIGWVIGGVILTFVVEIAANLVTMKVFGVHHPSANTQGLMQVAKSMPFFIIVITVIGPIMEELIFRKIIFGTLYRYFPFAVAAIASSLLFGFVHGDISFLLTYTAIGLFFCFLYWKTKRIFVSMIAHASMNSMAVVGSLFIDKLQKYEEQLKHMEGLIWHLFS